MQPDHEADDLQALLHEEYGAPRLDAQFSADLIGRLQAAAAPSATPTRTRRSPLAICLGAAAVAALVIAVIWISSPGTPGTLQMSGDADSDLASHRPNPPVAAPGASGRGGSVALKPGSSVRREETEASQMSVLSVAKVLEHSVPSATVIVVATALGSAPATGPGIPSDRLIFWMVTRVIKGRLTEKVFSTRASGRVLSTRASSKYSPEAVQKWYIGRETIVMLFSGRYAAGTMFFPIKYEAQVKALLPKGRVAEDWRAVLKRRSAAELDADWRALRGDAATAYPALGRLVASPDNTVAFLGEQLQKTKPVDTKRMARIKRLIGNLDHKQFQAREQAARELGALGHLAEPALRKALAGKPSPEAKARLVALLARLNANPSPEMTHQKRAVQALQFIGNPEARRLLTKLAAGPPTWLTQEAQAAAARLAKRASVAP